MKKIISILFVCLSFITGCGKDDLKLDLNQVYEKLSSLEANGKNIFIKNKIDGETLLDKYNFDTSSIEEYLLVMSDQVGDPNMYFVVKPQKGKKDIVKSEIKSFFEKYDNSWGLNGGIIYYPEAASKVQNRLNKEEGKYLIYIVSDNNNLVYKTIKESR